MSRKIKRKKKTALPEQPTGNLFSRIINHFPSDKTYWFLFSLLALFYVISYSTANVNCITNAMHDDLLFYKLAKNISEFNWLGEYNKLTLAKMPGFAIFLSLCFITGIPYLILLSLFQVLAVTFFLRNSMWLFRQTKLLSFILGFLLLYNPLYAVQFRIYRLQLSAICYIIFLGVILSMFNPEQPERKVHVKIIDGLTAFLGFGFLFFTREEKMLYYVVFIISIFLFLFILKKIKSIKRNLFLPVIGVSGILLFWLTIATLNHRHYGRFIICERTTKTFNRGIKAFNSVADDHLKPYYPLNSASREKIKDISEEVPEFRKLGQKLYLGSQGWNNHSRYFDKEEMAFKEIGMNDLPASHFEWYWIDCLQAAGYYENSVKLSDFYNILEEKINVALDEGRLKRREILLSAGPYFISKSDIKTIIKLIPVNYCKLFPNPRQIIKGYSDVLARENVPANKKDLLKWKRDLNVNVIQYGDMHSMAKAKSSLYNKIWNFFVILFAIIGGLLIHIAIPLAFFSFALALIKKKRGHAFLILITTSGYIMFLIMLTTLDIISGYDISSIIYYVVAYAAILISAFISLNTLFTCKIKSTENFNY